MASARLGILADGNLDMPVHPTPVRRPKPGGRPLLRFLTALLFCASLQACHRKEAPQRSASAEAATHLANGMYLATGIFDTRTAAETSAGESRVLTFYPLDDSLSERAAPRYVAVDTTQHVSFVEAAPSASLDPTGRTILGVALDAPNAERLKEFSTRHLGKSAAMIVGDEIVSVHKIRATMTEGKLQITSCGPDVAKVLYSKLAARD